MRRVICFALFGLIVSTGPAFAQRRQSARPHGRVFVHGSHFRWHHRGIYRHHYWFDPYRFSITDFAPPPPDVSMVPFAPTYYFYHNESSTIHPRLVFKDHMTYTVEDYWRVDDQLHFITSEEGGTKSVPRTLPFADLDVQATTDALSAQGFKFRIRDEPIEQWLQHHPPEKTSKTKAAKKAR
jgi:hypothetical protein